MIEKEENCPVCRKKITSDTHCITCSKMKWCIKNRHDNIVRYLVKHIKRKNRPNIVSLKAGTMPKNKIDKREPDITFVLDGMEYVIDVTFCKIKGA